MFWRPSGPPEAKSPGEKLLAAGKNCYSHTNRVSGTMIVSRHTANRLIPAFSKLHFQRFVPLLALSLALSPLLRADDFWKQKPSAQWSHDQALKLVRHSPWAKVEVVVFLRRENQASYSIPTGRKHCDPDAIDANGKCLQKGKMEAPVDSSRDPNAAPRLSPSTAFLVRWESVTPVTQAFARLEELGERTLIAFQAQAPRVPADRYVITVKLEQPGFTGFEPFTVTSDGEPDLRATLKTRAGTVTPLETEFTGTGANSSVHFFFPRTLNRVPLLGPGVDSADFNMEGFGYAVRSKFTLDPELLKQPEILTP